MKASHASHLGNAGSGLERCCNKPFLLILRPPAPPLDRCDHLRPRNRHSASPRITPRTCSVRVRQTRRPSTQEYHISNVIVVDQNDDLFPAGRFSGLDETPVSSDGRTQPY